MVRHRLVSGLPESLAPLPRSPAPPCTPCVEGRQRAAPHSSFPPTTAPLQTLHLDVWGPSPVLGPRQERYFLIVVDDYSRYTTVFPLRRKADVPTVLEPWLLARGGVQGLYGLRLHSDRCVRYAAHQLNVWPSDARPRVTPIFLRTAPPPLHPAPLGVSHVTPQSSPPQRPVPVVSGGAGGVVAEGEPVIAEPGGVLAGGTGVPGGVVGGGSGSGGAGAGDMSTAMPTPRTPQQKRVEQESWPHEQVLLRPQQDRVEEEPREQQGGQVPQQHSPEEAEQQRLRDLPDSAYARFVRGPLPSPHVPPFESLSLSQWTRRSPLSRAVFPEPGRSHYRADGPFHLVLCSRVPPPPILPQPLELSLTVFHDPLSDYLRASRPVVSLVLSALVTHPTAPLSSVPALVTTVAGFASSHRLDYAAHLVSGPARLGAGGTRGTGGAGAGSTGGTGGAGAAGPGGTRTRGAGAAEAGGAGGAGGALGGAGARGSGGAEAANGMGTVPSRPFFYPQPRSSLPPPDSALRLSLTERREPETCASTPVCAHRVARPHPPTVPRTHGMALRPSSVPQRVVLPEPPTSSLPHVPDPESDLARAANPTVTRLLATIITDPEFESTTAFSLVTKLVDFAARSRLDYVASLVTDSKSVCPPSIEGEPALGNDVLEDRQFELECLVAALPHFASMLLCLEGDPDALDIPTPRSYTEAITGEYSSQWKTAMDAEMASWKSTGTYIDKVPPPRANIVDGLWIFRVKRPSGSPPAYKARYVAQGFSQREGVNFFQTFSPTPKITTLWVLLHVAAQRDYELHSLDFSIAFFQGSLHEEISLRRPPGFTGTTTLAALRFAPSTADPSLFLRTDTSLPPFYVLVYVDDLVFASADTEALALVKSELQRRQTCTDLGELRSYLGFQITRDRARCTITLTQSHMVHQVLRRFGFQYSSPQPTPLPTGHSLSAPPSDESVEPSGPYPELVGCLMYLMACTRPDLAYPLSLLARYVALGRHQKVHWDAAKRVLRYLCTTSGMGLVLGGQSSVVLTGHFDAFWADDQATQRSSQGYTFGLGSGSVLWRSTHSSFVLGSSCEADIYAEAMAAQELR
ncbi:unnamed protein product [Closterium sp. NIES-54]